MKKVTSVLQVVLGAPGRLMSKTHTGDWFTRKCNLLETVSLPQIQKTKVFLRYFYKREILGDDAKFADRIAEGRFLIPSLIWIWLTEAPISNK